MKLILISCLLFVGIAHALDYDPQFNLKHRYNRHPEAKQAYEKAQAQRVQHMEAEHKTTPQPKPQKIK